MTGKHDKKSDVDQSANLLLTGPIAIRGLGRSVKDALLPGRPSRHRAFAGEPETEAGGIEPTPAGLELTDGPVVEAGPSTDLSDRDRTQPDEPGEAFPQDVDVAKTEVADGPGEDRADDRRDDEHPADADVDQPWGQDSDSVAHKDGAAPDESGSEDSTGEGEPVVEFTGVDDFALMEEDASEVIPLGVREAEQSASDVQESAPVAEYNGVGEPEPVVDFGGVDDFAMAEEVASGEPEPVVDLGAVDDFAQADESTSEDAEESVPDADADSTAEQDPELEPDSSTHGTEHSADDAAVEALAIDEQPFNAETQLDVEPDGPAPLAAEASAAESSEPEQQSVGTPRESTDDAAVDEQVPVESPSEDEPLDGAEPDVEFAAAAADEPIDATSVESRDTEAVVEPVVEITDGADPVAMEIEPQGDAAAPAEGEQEPPSDDARDPDAEDVPVSSGGLESGQPDEQTAPLDEQVGSVEDEREPTAYDESPSEEESSVDVDDSADPDLVGNGDATPVDDLDPRFIEDESMATTPVEEPAARRGWTTAEELFNSPALALPPTEDGPAPAPQESIDDFAVASGDADDTAVADDSATEAAPADQTAVIAPAAAVGAAAAGRPPRPRGSGGSARPPRRARPVRERFGREAIGIAVLVVLALVCGGLITAVVLKTQRDAAVAAAEAANYTPPPLATPEPTSTGPVVAVISDGRTSTAASGVTSAQRWTAVLEKSLDGTLHADASSGMGYAVRGGSGQTFVTAAAKIPSNADVVVFFGGASDSEVSMLSLAKAATEAFSAAKEQAPDAKVIVVGPAIRNGVSPADLTVIRNALRSSAGIAKATWIDPIDKAWLPTNVQGDEPAGLTASDEKSLASKMESVVNDALK